MFTVMTLREGFTWEDENVQVYRIFTDSRKDAEKLANEYICLLYTSPSPRDS